MSMLVSVEIGIDNDLAIGAVHENTNIRIICSKYFN